MSKKGEAKCRDSTQAQAMAAAACSVWLAAQHAHSTSVSAAAQEKESEWGGGEIGRATMGTVKKEKRQRSERQSSGGNCDYNYDDSHNDDDYSAANAANFSKRSLPARGALDLIVPALDKRAGLRHVVRHTI